MHHQNLVQIQDFDCEGDTWFLVMEYVEGFTLRRIIGAATRFGLQLPLSVIAEIGRQACDGLHYAHQATDESGEGLELVHRDIKPSNLILSPHGVVKVLDFGISKGRLREERTGSVKGTWGYMAPEQSVGDEVGPPADVFGLATVLYELASKTPMFHKRSKEDIRRLLKDDHAARLAATLDPTAYGRLIGVLVRALQRDPEARFGTAEAFGRALSELLPDTITARDEVTRFYQKIVELEAEAAQKAQVAQGELPNRDDGVSAPSEPAVAAGEPAPPSLLVTFTVGALLSAALLVALALGSLVLLTEPTPTAQAKPTPVAAAPTAPPAAPEPAGAEPSADDVPDDEPVTVTIVRRSEPTPAPAATPPPTDEAEPTAEPEAAQPPPDADTARLTIGCRQGAEVYIGGQYAGDAPVRKDVPPGRYAVAIVAADGRRKTVSLTVDAGDEVRRTWDFDRMEWR
jgi:serine/threonine-protein kinase